MVIGRWLNPDVRKEDLSGRTEVAPPGRAHAAILYLLIALGVALTANLFVHCWRTLLPAGFGFAWPLLLAYFFTTLVAQGLFVWFLYSRFRKREIGPAPGGLSADVFVPACDEPVEIVEHSLRAARDITYPHRTYLLDDSAAGSYAELAERLGTECLRRDGNAGHKAGNINAALPRTSGDFIAIFDVDHAPAPEFLDRTLPPFADPRVAFVQAMQTFRNSAESSIAEAAAQTAMEYFNITATCNDSIGACSHHGSNAVFRRAALADVGGYQPGLAEDLETSLALHGRGWKSAYVCEPIAPGLAPVDFRAFAIQQLKWSRGVFAAAAKALRSGTFFRLTWQQKLSYTVRFSYYTLGLLFLLSMLQVLLHLFGANVAAFEGALARAFPLIVVAILIRWFMLRTCGTEPEARKGRCAKGISLAVAIWPVYVLSLACAVLGIRIPFMSTPKTASRTVPSWIVLPQVLMIAALLAGIAWKLVHWQEQPAPWTLLFAAWVIAQQWMLIVPLRQWWRGRGEARPSTPSWGLWVLGLASAYLALRGLDAHLFWDDEANVGFFARNLLLGRSLSGWDGNNLWGFRNGALLDQQLLNLVDPPLQYLVAAGGFALFGVSTWAARLPFVLIGLCSIPLLHRFLREYDLPAPIPQLTVALYGLNTSFLLYVRQARYYALTITLGLAAYLLFLRYVKTGRPSYLGGLAACGALLFVSNYITAAATLAALAAVWIVFHQARHTRRLVLPAVALLLAAVGYVGFTGHLMGLLSQTLPGGLPAQMTLFGMHLADINELGWLPWVLATCAGYRIVARGDRTLAEWMLFTLVFVLAAGLLSPQPVAKADHSDVRYIVALLPVFMTIVGTVVGQLWQSRPQLGRGVPAIVVLTNLFSLNPLAPRFRSDLAAHIYEIHNDYATAIDAVGALLAENARSGDRVLVSPTKYAIPLIFYGANRYRIVGQLTKDTHLEAARIESLDPQLFVENAEPDWIVFFGPDEAYEKVVEACSRRGASYVPFDFLDVHHVSEIRPEIFWHSFGPRRNPHGRRGGIHVYRKVGWPVPREMNSAW